MNKTVFSTVTFRECALMNQSQRYDANNKNKYPGGMIHPGDRELKDGWEFWIYENEAIDLGNFKIWNRNIIS